MIEHSSLIPELVFHHYWEQKAHFLMEVDTYSEWSMFAVEEGSFQYEFASTSGLASKGEIVLCPPHTPFRRKVISPLSFHFIIFNWGSEHSDSLAQDKELVGKIRLHDTKRLSSNYYYLRNKAEQYGPADQRVKRHMLKDIWLLHCEEMNKNISLLDVVSSEDLLMNQAAEYFKQHAGKSIKIKSLADTLGLTPVQLTRQFFRTFGITPIDFLTSIRLQKAKNMLMDTDLPLDEIAIQCGYESGFYFSRVFSRNMKVSPSVYRKAYRV